MKISILTLFPQMFTGPFDYSIIKRAREKNLIELAFINIRNFGIGRHKIVDDTPYGGGLGMIMRVDVLHKAIEYTQRMYISSKAKLDLAESRIELKKNFQQTQTIQDKQKIILLSASGQTFNQGTAKAFSKLDHLILICGHYEGVDERIRQFIDAEVSIGDFVLTGGEIPAMLIVDTVTRLIPGVLPDGVTDDESFSRNEQTNPLLLEYPHYTKPQQYRNLSVPDILLSGNHKQIGEWRQQKSEEKTQQFRPDLIK